MRIPLRGAFRSLFSRTGYEVRSRGSSFRSFDEGLAALSPRIRPRTVIDIGVASGTPALYSHFPPSSSRYLLVEPDPHHFSALDSLASALPAIVERVACGSSRGDAVLHTFSDHRKSSFRTPLRPLPPSGDIGVPLETLDGLVSKHRLSPPYLVKIDTEGSEIDVIRGGTRVFSEACAAIIEVSFASRFSADASFSDVACLMKESGLHVFDIVAGAYNARGILHQADIIFIRHDLIPR